MAPIAQGKGIVRLDNAGGTLTEISGSVSDFQIDLQSSVGTFFVVNDDWQKALDGGRSWTVTLQVLFETGTAGYSLVRDWGTGVARGARTLQIDSPDSASGSQRYTGEVRLASIGSLAKATGGSGQPIIATIQLTGDGALTPSTIV